MNGQLNEQPLAELIREILLHRLAGTMRLSRESAKAVVYFEAGDVIYAASNLKELRLSEYLKKQELVTAEQLQAAGNNRSDLTLAAALTERGLLDAATVQKLIGKQVSDLLRVVLLWTEGAWEFDERSHLGDSIRVKLDVPGLLLQAARKMDHQFVATRLSNPSEKISLASVVPNFKGLLPEEGFLLSRIEGPVQLSQLVSLSGLREPEAAKVVYGLALGGFIEREDWPIFFKKKDADITEKLASQPEEPGDTVSSPEVSVHTLAAELEELLARLNSASSYYEILDIEEGAGSGDIKNSYYALARRYHPDRFHLHAGTPLHSSIESAFAKIAQAYVTLSDPVQRSGYDIKLTARNMRPAVEEVPQSTNKRRTVDAAKSNASEDSSESEWARAESNFKEGFVALQHGQTKAAIVNLAAAARVAPGEARFRAYYGRALASVKDSRRLAEAEMQAAIKLDPKNSTYRLMLAELYCDLGFLRRAASELKRVTSVEPDNPVARRLMQRIEMSGSTPG